MPRPRAKMKSAKKNSPKNKSKRTAKKQIAKSGNQKTSVKARKTPSKARKTPTKARKTPIKVPYIQKGYHHITPYLVVDDATQAIDFYKKAFNAKEIMCMTQPNGKIGHAELKFGDAKIMLADECPEMGALSPKSVGGSPVSIHLYVKDVDSVVEEAQMQGATLLRPVADMFYGDRTGTVKDPFGHVWHVSTHIENVSMAKLKKRAEEMFSKQ